MDNEQQRLMEIFHEARAIGSAEERDAYLKSVCGDDDALRRQVEVLLQAHTQLGDFLKPPDDDPSGESVGTAIGRYKLLERIGEGGFGVVYMAEQKEPVQRRVALKVVKAGMDTKEVIARFEAERQALALMEHPNIAKVLDAGATENGRPYFVMELVNGIPVTEYCDRHNLPMADRLQLFMQVCHAVQHAHQKAVIHRDLKPSNILVTLIDGEPIAKVIDFGVAKALGQSLTEKTLFTGFLRMVGTPAYMSPEQAELSGVDVDTRADIYALGVLLYELLTGVTPFDNETLQNAALDEVRRMIQETDPPKPSTRLHTIGEKLTDVARHRQAEPAALDRLVRGDLDWIVMKCLEKERVRRYDTADAVLQDVQRHLDHQPVQAGPPSTAYRARKFVRRHHMGVTLGAVTMSALLVGLSIAVVGFVQARQQRDRAAVAEQQAMVERDSAITAEAKAERERNYAELLAAEAALDRGQSKLDAGDTLGLADMAEAFELAAHNPDFRQQVGRRWSTWHALWSRRTIASCPMRGTPSPDFLQFVTVSAWPPVNNSSEARLHDTLTGQPVTAPLEHESVVKGCAFSPDGRLLATVTEKGTIHLWDRRTGKPARPPCETGVEELTWLKFSPDGRYVVAFPILYPGPSAEKVALVNLQESGASVRLLEHRNLVRNARFSPDGELLAVQALPDLQIWRTSDPIRTGTPLGIGQGTITSYTFSSNGKRLAYIPSDQEGIRLADARTMEEIRTLPAKNAATIGIIVLSHDGRVLASFDVEHNIELWKTESGSEPYASYRVGAIADECFAFSPDGSLLVCGDNLGRIHVLRTYDGQLLCKLPFSYRPRPVFLENGVLAVSTGTRAMFWNLSAPPLAVQALADDFLAHALALDPSGSYLAVGSEDELRLWTLQPSLKLEHSIPMPGQVSALTWLEAEQRFMAFCDDGSLFRVEPGTGMATSIGNVSNEIELEYFQSASLSPDGRKLVLFKPGALVVDTRTGAHRLYRDDGNVMSASFRPDSQQLALGVTKWQMYLYDLNSESKVLAATVKRFENGTRGLAYHPDGNLIAVCVRQNTLHLHDPRINRDIGSARTTTVEAELARFSADGSLLAVAGPLKEGGHGIELWHVDPQRGLFASGLCLRQVLPVQSVAFSPDGKMLVVGGRGSTRLWRLPAEPKDLAEVQSQTWSTLGFRIDENGRRTYLDAPGDESKAIRARLTQNPVSSDTPLDASVK